ncbi:tetraspanin-7 [Neodiprion pinetum]|uniref:Tetraspanin n=1 Tax=Neodiprion lecontei TaxID=441921 RepID=A0A6J0C5Y8_NEOLC|nr:tetraspanin-7 [Neodiprion lecontei]XP_046413695.1 tetraspanin-7-like [Neodiprion fabricii]XP_046468863.1 tetraspanin-7-like [Neodiprion pinetum]XP_046603590.1 tetraspanin-7-like [Neodiprion virginianus]
MGKHLQTVAAMACMKTLLILFNFAFGCTGVLMLCVGIWMRIQLREYVDMSIEGSGAAPLALACLGILVVVASILACCCTARGHPALLYLYGAFLAVVVLLELGSGASVYAYRNALTEGFDQGLNESLVLYVDDPNKHHDIDTMQSTLHCCGNRGYTDWHSINLPEEIPKSCCKQLENPCDSSNLDNVYTQGCYNRVVDFINSNIGLVAGSAVGVAFFPLIGVFLACCLASNINKAKYEQVA